MFDTDVVAENGFHFVKWHVKRFNLRYYTTIFCQKKFLTSHLLRAKKIKLLPAAMFDTDVVEVYGFHAVKLQLLACYVQVRNIVWGLSYPLLWVGP